MSFLSASEQPACSPCSMLRRQESPSGGTQFHFNTLPFRLNPFTLALWAVSHSGLSILLILSHPQSCKGNPSLESFILEPDSVLRSFGRMLVPSSSELIGSKTLHSEFGVKGATQASAQMSYGYGSSRSRETEVGHESAFYQSPFDLVILSQCSSRLSRESGRHKCFRTFRDTAVPLSVQCSIHIAFSVNLAEKSNKHIEGSQHVERQLSM